MRASRPKPKPIDSVTFQLPLIATPPATGFSQPTTDYVEGSIDFNRLIYRHPAATYLMKVARDGSSGSDLLADDVVVIDAAETPQLGDLVVAQIEDDFLLCRFERQDGAILLFPENADYRPQVVPSETASEVLFGVVKLILHRPKRQRRRRASHRSRWSMSIMPMSRRSASSSPSCSARASSSPGPMTAISSPVQRRLRPSAFPWVRRSFSMRRSSRRKISPCARQTGVSTAISRPG